MKLMIRQRVPLPEPIERPRIKVGVSEGLPCFDERQRPLVPQDRRISLQIWPYIQNTS